MKTVATLLAALVASANAFAPSSSFTGSTAFGVANGSPSALSMEMERTYIMVRILKNFVS